MPRTIALILLILPLLSFMCQQKKRVIFFGDSITQAAVHPGGYINKLGELAAQNGSAEKFEFIGAGISGNKIYDLYLRLEGDVLKKNPDVVFIYIGVNDVWHKRTHGTGTDADKFERFYSAIIKEIQANGSKVILCTPAAIGERTDFTNDSDGDLNLYCSMIRDLAKKYELTVVDLRQAFLDYNKKFNTENKESGILTTDRVHLNLKGNQLVAEEIWKVLSNL